MYRAGSDQEYPKSSSHWNHSCYHFPVFYLPYNSPSLLSLYPTSFCDFSPLLSNLLSSPPSLSLPISLSPPSHLSSLSFFSFSLPLPTLLHPLPFPLLPSLGYFSPLIIFFSSSYFLSSNPPTQLILFYFSSFTSLFPLSLFTLFLLFLLHIEHRVSQHPSFSSPSSPPHHHFSFSIPKFSMISKGQMHIFLCDLIKLELVEIIITL